MPHDFQVDSVTDTSAPDPQDRYEGRCALVVDDSSVNRKIAAKALERLGFRTHLSCNGLQAVEAFGSSRFDIVLMDLHMPELDGFAAARRIRLKERGRSRVPIVALSGSSADGDGPSYDETSFDDFLTKPLRMDQLLPVLRRWIG